MDEGNGIYDDVVPTPVGVNRLDTATFFMVGGGPHARGGEPEADREFYTSEEWSPRPWG